MNRISAFFLFGTALHLCSLGTVWGGTASSITGLNYTGLKNGGGLQTGGSLDANWKVTYATTDGGLTANPIYSGTNDYAYVVSTPAGGWTANTTTAQWIVPPGAQDGSGTANVGGTNLPGNGTTGTNAASYVYTLAFDLTGTGSGTVTSQVSITLTLAADDQAKVYINPTLNANGSINTTSSTLGATELSAWNSTKVLTLQNFDDGAHANNATFVIGKNYLVIQVDNTNSLTGNSNSSSLNPGGLLVYQVGAATILNPSKPTPEVGAWLPVLGALGFFCARRFRTSKTALAT